MKIFPHQLNYPDQRAAVESGGEGKGKEVNAV